MRSPDLLARHTLHVVLCRPQARVRGRVGPTEQWAEAIRRTAEAGALALSRARAAVRTRFPLPVAVFWAMVVGVDFVNDWIIEGVTTTFRPVSAALFDMVVWWTPWVLAAPLLSIPMRRLDPARIGWRASLAGHFPLMLAAISLHALAAAWTFAEVRGGSVVRNFEHFARAFTLSEALLYGGLVVAYHVGWSHAPSRAGMDDPGASSTPEAVPEPRWIRRFAVRDGDVTRFVPVDDISHVEAAGNYVRLHAADGEHLVRATLSGVEERLDPGRFRRIHRSTIVNVDRVARVDAWFNGDCLATLDDGRELRVSRTFRSALMDPLG